MNKQQEPRLRFKGFTGSWEYKKFENVLSIKSGMSQKEIEVSDGIYPILATGGEIGRTNTALYDKESVLIGRKGTIDKPYYMNTPFWTVDTLFYSELKNNIDGKFLYFLFQCIEWRKLDTSTGVPSLTSTTIHEIQRYFPSKPEQTHLGLFFRRLDSQIAESRAVLEKSRQLKKAMLAKMFPANGEKIPKIRFKGFEGEWERNELGCLGYCLSGIGFSENEQGGENGIPFFKVSDMNLSGNEVYLKKANNYVTQEQIDKQRWQVIQQLPCIFFAKVGAALLLNRKRLVNTPFLLDNNTMAFILNSSLDNYFMKTLFDTIDLPALAQIGALPSINAKDIEKNIVFIPTPKEQTAIGNFFRQLDETIALQSAEVEKLNQLKKGLLAAMLV